MGRDMWGLVDRLKDEMRCYACRVDPGPGTNSPCSSEAYGLFDGLCVAWTSQITGNIQLTLDNQSVASVFQRCELSTPRFTARLLAGLLGRDWVAETATRAASCCAVAPGSRRVARWLYPC